MRQRGREEAKGASWRLLPCLAVLLAGAVMPGPAGHLHAEGVTAVTPPAMYPANSWQGRSGAVLRIMRRLDSHVERVPLHMGEEVQYGTLSLRLDRCLEKPAGLPAESAALLHVGEKQESGSPAFDGWMFTNDPALGAYAGALYDVQVIACEGEDVAPMAGPLPKPAVPHLSAILAQHVEADDGQAASGGFDGGAGAQGAGSRGAGVTGRNIQGQNGAGQAAGQTAAGTGSGQGGGNTGPMSLLPPAAPAPAQTLPAPQGPGSANSGSASSGPGGQ